MNEPTEDLVDRLAGIAPGSPLAALRRERPEIVRHTEGAYRALLEPDDPGPLSPAERAGIALQVAATHADAELAAHYQALVASRGGAPKGARWQAIREHVELMVSAPREAGPADLAELRAAGLTEGAIVTLAQLVTFVSYQTRVTTGLKLIGSTPSGGQHG